MVARLLIAAIVVAGCSGVSPSVKLGVLHQTPGNWDSKSNETVSDAWALGGSIKASFPQSGLVVESCGLVGYIRSTVKHDSPRRMVVPLGPPTTVVPAELCVEIDTAELEMR